jgi:CheY-like chemotaxis protein
VILHGGPLLIEADPVQLEQVIVNLATNARDAMRAGGKLTIETQGTDVAGAAGPEPSIAPGTYAVLSVRDTGVGMDAETRRLAFHPFFTTKEVGQGTGLGLATVYGIVEQSRGRVLVESEPGKGSCFSVFLPRASGTVDAEAQRGSPAMARPLRGATVLLAEDEPMVRAVTSRGLSNAGFAVIEAENGERALQVAIDHDGPIDLLVTDVVMSKMGGVELAARLGAMRPGLRVLYVSGYAWNAELPPSDAAAGVDFLRKPFTPDVLVDRASRLLAVDHQNDATTERATRFSSPVTR